MDKTQQQEKINYVKPELFDLGAVTPAIGGTCAGPGDNPTGKPACAPSGNWVVVCNPVGIGGFPPTF